MTKLDIDVENVIKIDPEGKYVLFLSQEDMRYAEGIIRDWWEKGDPFLFVGDHIKMVRIDGDDNDQD